MAPACAAEKGGIGPAPSFVRRSSSPLTTFVPTVATRLCLERGRAGYLCGRDGREHAVARKDRERHVADRDVLARELPGHDRAGQGLAAQVDREADLRLLTGVPLQF